MYHQNQHEINQRHYRASSPKKNNGHRDLFISNDDDSRKREHSNLSGDKLLLVRRWDANNVAPWVAHVSTIRANISQRASMHTRQYFLLRQRKSELPSPHADAKLCHWANQSELQHMQEITIPVGTTELSSVVGTRKATQNTMKCCNAMRNAVSHTEIRWDLGCAISK